MADSIYTTYGENGKEFSVTRFSRGTGRGIGYQLTLGDTTTVVALKDILTLGATLMKESGFRLASIMKQLDRTRK